MAKQKGIIKLEGTIDDVSFYKTADGYLAREKGGVDGETIRNSPRFQRTRENNAEFKEVTKAVDLFCKAFRGILQEIPSNDLRARLMKRMYEVLYSDTINKRGERKVNNGDIELLEKFEFVRGVKYKSIFRIIPYIGVNTGINVAQLISSASTFIPRDVMVAPSCATHYRILIAGGQINFETGWHNVTLKQPEDKSLDIEDGVSMISLFHLQPNINLPLFMVMGIKFSQLVNNKFYPLEGGAMFLAYAKKGY
jgi:hypothetical protein